jgi:transposase-like protein
MIRKNPYKKRTKLSRYKTEQIIKCFALDLTANKTAEILGIERKTINRWYNYIREAIYWYCEREKAEVFK